MNYSRKKTAYWRGLLAQYVASGLAPVEFCQSRGLVAKSFCKWRQRLRAELPHLAFRRSRAPHSQEALELVPVVPPQGDVHSRPGHSGSCTCGGASIQAGRLRLHVDGGFDGETLRRVLKAGEQKDTPGIP